MTTDGQFNRRYCKWLVAWLNIRSHNVRRAKYWHRVANKWDMKMQKAGQQTKFQQAVQ